MKNNVLNLTLIVSVVVVCVLSIVNRPVVEVRTVDGQPVQVRDLGAAPGPENYVHQYFYSGLAEGGVYNVSTTSATLTLTDAAMRDARVISVANTANSAALTLTLPASTTWPSLPLNGVTQMWVIDNLHSAAATTSTIAAGTGVDIDGTTANDDVINGGVSGRLECWRLPTSDIRCIVEEMVDAG